MVPCSSKIEKFEKLILKKQSENKPTDSVRIIKIFGKKSVLLFQDISTDALILLQKNPTKHITFSPVIHSVGYHNPIFITTLCYLNNPRFFFGSGEIPFIASSKRFRASFCSSVSFSGTVTTSVT